MGQEYEFDFHREYLSDSIFREKSIFSVDTLNTVDLFSIHTGRWFFKFKGRRYLFFHAGSKVESIFYINGVPYNLIWKTILIASLYELRIKPKGINVSNLPHYTFSPKDGILEIIVEVDLVRKKK